MDWPHAIKDTQSYEERNEFMSRGKRLKPEFGTVTSFLKSDYL